MSRHLLKESPGVKAFVTFNRFSARKKRKSFQTEDFVLCLFLTSCVFYLLISFFFCPNFNRKKKKKQAAEGVTDIYYVIEFNLFLQTFPQH